MRKGVVAVLEVGSKKLTCVIGQRGVNGTFVIKSLAEVDYDGFSESDFFDVNGLTEAVIEVTGEAVKNARSPIDKLYIGVPGEFSIIRTKESLISFPRKKRIKKREIEDLHSRYRLSENSDYRIIDVAAVYYTLDDNRRVLNPENCVSSKLGGLLSYVLCDKFFIKLFENICRKACIDEVEFISECLAESLLLFTDEERQYNRILVDVGYITTTMAVVRGNGILFQKAFSFGGGHITAGLMEKLGVSFDLAELLKRKINLGYDVNADGVYKLLLNDEEYRIPLQKANVAVRFSLDELAEKLEAALRECPIELTANVNVSLTGGGLAYMRGGKEYLSNRLELGVGVVAPRVPYMNKPDESACLGLLNYALIKNEN